VGSKQKRRLLPAVSGAAAADDIEPGALEIESFAYRDNYQAFIQVKQESLSQCFSQYLPGLNTL